MVRLVFSPLGSGLYIGACKVVLGLRSPDAMSGRGRRLEVV
jgi:hypothetical protein